MVMIRYHGGGERRGCRGVEEGGGARGGRRGGVGDSVAKCVAVGAVPRAGGMGEGVIVVGMWLYCCLVFSGNVFNFVVKFINVRFFFLLLKRSLLPRFFGGVCLFLLRSAFN